MSVYAKRDICGTRDVSVARVETDTVDLDTRYNYVYRDALKMGKRCMHTN